MGNSISNETQTTQISSSLDAERLKLLESLFHKISENRPQISEREFLNYLDLPEYLSEFGQHFFVAIRKQTAATATRQHEHHDKKHLPQSDSGLKIKSTAVTQSNGDTDPEKGITLPKFIRAIEICWKGSTSEQMDFLIAGYSDDSPPLSSDPDVVDKKISTHHSHSHSHSHHLQTEVSSAPKHSQKIKLSELSLLFRDCGLLSVYNRIFETQFNQNNEQKRKEIATDEKEPQQTPPSDSRSDTSEDSPVSEPTDSESNSDSDESSKQKLNKSNGSEMQSPNNVERADNNKSESEHKENKNSNVTMTQTQKKETDSKRGDLTTHTEIRKEDFEKTVKPIIEAIRRKILRLQDEKNRDEEKADKDKQEKDTVTETSKNSDVAIESSQISEWVMEYTPSLLKCLENFVCLRFLSEQTTATQSISWLPMALNMTKSSLYSFALLWIIMTLFDSKKKSCKLLYSSIQFGRSLNRFCHHVLNYNGPTLLLVQTTKGELFGAYVSQPWRITSSYQGDSDCFLFSLFPTFDVIRPGGVEKNYVYLYTNKHSFSGFPVGLGFGGTLKSFRLFLDEDLMKGQAKSSCNSFNPGKIVSELIFEIKQVEVWGYGGETADEEQARAIAREQKITERARKVNRKLIGEGGWDTNPDKFILDLVGKTGVSDGFREEIQKAKKQMKANEKSVRNAEKELLAKK
jgi:hypothetical protein